MNHPPLPAGDQILVLNCGSSSIKFALFDAAAQPLAERAGWQGHIEGIGTGAAQLVGLHPRPQDLPLDAEQPYLAALHALRRALAQHLAQRPGHGLRAVAHRVVHGGRRHSAPVWVDAAVLAELRALIPLAPLHQPFALNALEAMLQDHPELPQLACFDTAFHHDLPEVEQMLPLDWQAWTDGVRRYGFHGLSYDYISQALARRHDLPAAARVVVAHLGSGASLCALHQGRSVATTMGFSALDGLMMGSRCGSLDPGALLHLMDTRGWDTTAASDWLYHRSGLLGLGGLSGDPRSLQAAEADPQHGPRARAALALYVRRIVREIGALTAVLGGLDALVFTAGIGEHNADIRQRIVAQLGFVQAQLDPAANARHGAPATDPPRAPPLASTLTSPLTASPRPDQGHATTAHASPHPAATGPDALPAGRIDAAGSPLPVLVIPTNEEWVAAYQVVGMASTTHPD